MTFIDFNINAQLTNENLSQEISREILKKSMNAMRSEAILQASRFSDTGEIISKIELIEVSEDEYILESGAQHSAAMEYGTVPHWAPIAPLKKWAGRKLGDESIGYAVQKKIAKEGTEAKPFMRRSLDVTQQIILPQLIQESKTKYS